MAKKTMEEKFDIDTEFPLKEVEREMTIQEEKTTNYKASDNNYISCLRNEKIIVRHIPKQSGMVTNPKHVLYGGMAENATKTYVVPKLSSGVFVNVLTNDEKAFLEEVMGLEYNALSIHKKKDNFWDDSNEEGVSKVRLNKQDNYFDLSNPEDYIRYKILLANKNFIAPSLQVLQDSPKATYEFVIIAQGEENKTAKDNMSTTMKCYKEYGKVEDNADILRLIVETIEGRASAANTKLEFLQTKINDLIQADNKLFLKIITDPLLTTKVLIKKGVDAGILSNRDNHYYVRKDNSPLCEHGEESTLNIAAKYLNSPKHQELKFMIEAALK